MPGGQSAVYEFTLFKEQFNEDGERIRGPFEVSDVASMCCHTCKKFTFQLEACPSNGRLHYQGRLSLVKKTTAACAAKLFPDSGIKLLPTATDNITGAPFYVLKVQTRVDGPWTEKDFEDPPTKHFKRYRFLEDDELYPWQTEVLDLFQKYQEREVNMIIDPTGSCGKTSLARKCLQKNLSVKFFKAIDSMKDLMQAVMSCGKFYDCYCFDVPRGLKKTHLSSFFAGVESLKDGYAYDHRHKFKDAWFDPPTIWIFSNKRPNIKYLSKDRWTLWRIGDDKKLWPLGNDWKKPKNASRKKKVRRSRINVQEAEDLSSGDSEEEVSMEEEMDQGQEGICQSGEESDSSDC